MPSIQGSFRQFGALVSLRCDSTNAPYELAWRGVCERGHWIVQQRFVWESNLKKKDSLSVPVCEFTSAINSTQRIGVNKYVEDTTILSVHSFLCSTCTWSSSVTGSEVLVDLSAIRFLFTASRGLALEKSAKANRNSVWCDSELQPQL